MLKFEIHHNEGGYYWVLMDDSQPAHDADLAMSAECFGTLGETYEAIEEMKDASFAMKMAVIEEAKMEV